jgi:hypothetical protein
MLLSSGPSGEFISQYLLFLCEYLATNEADTTV